MLRVKQVESKKAAARRFLGALNVESLERRELLAGDVTAFVSGDNLTIRGDAASNQLLIRGGTGSSVTISSLDGATTINGQAGPLVLSGVSQNFTVTMGDGDDIIRFAGDADNLYRMYGNGTISLDAGNDEVGFSNFSVWKNLTVDAGSGNDKLIASRDLVGGVTDRGWGLRVGQTTNVVMGEGNDQLSLRDGDHLGVSIIAENTGDDNATVRDTRFRNTLTIGGGSGYDRLFSVGNTFEKKATVNLFEADSNILNPTAVNDTASVTRGGTTTIDLAANDDAGSSALNLASIIITQQPTSGTLTINANGTVGYTHNGSSGASDSFKYTIRDTTGSGSNEATVTLSVTDAPANQVPVAVNDVATLTVGGSQAINVAANDTDADGTLNLSSIVITTQPTSGSIVVNANGTVTYTSTGSVATTDAFSYTIKDNTGAVSNIATVAISLAVPNVAPVANNDIATLLAGGTTAIGVATNDTDGDGSLALSSIIITQQPTSGTAVVNANGTITYTHNGSGTLTDTIKYTIKDNNGAVSNEGTVTLTITPLNQAPVALGDSAAVNEGGTQNINLAANDSVAQGLLNLAGLVITQQPTYGTLTVNADGTVTYVHNGSETTTDSFRYTIADLGAVVSNEAVVNLTINPVSDTPVAVADSATVGEGGSVTIGVASNDTDAEGPPNVGSIVITQQPANGTLTVNPNGTIVYSHNGSETTTDTFRYTIKDAEGNTSNEAIVLLTVTGVDALPTAANDTATVNEGGTQPINIAANDSDAEGALDVASLAIVQQPAHGTLTVNLDGTVSYTHDGSETTTDSFTYTVKDLQGNVSTAATVNITVTPVSDTPTGVADVATVDAGNSVSINVAGNDVDQEGQLNLSSLVVTQDPLNGTLTINANGTIVYSHDGSATTTDTFRYTIKDADGNTSTETTVTLSITSSNVAPTAAVDTASVDEGGTVVIDLAGNDTDPEGSLDPASIVVNQPFNGAVTVHNDGTVSYAHNGTETTSDIFSYTIADAAGNVSNSASVTLSITLVNDAPLGVNDAANVTEDSGVSATGNVLTNDTDAEGNTLSVTAVNGSAANLATMVTGQYGTFNIAADGSFTYTVDDSNPDVDNLDDLETLLDAMTYTLSDGTDTSLATLNVTINGHTNA